MTAPTRPPIRADFELFERNCSDCHHPILWARVGPDRDEWMPIDADPVDTGNVLAYPDPAAPRRLVADVIGTRRLRRSLHAAGFLLFQHHRLSCMYADRWARGPKAMRPHPTGVRPAPAVDPLPEPEGLFDV
jgi:hypothetical protein